MADIDKISVNNTTYNIKDSTARESISSFNPFSKGAAVITDMNSFQSGIGLTDSTTLNMPTSTSLTYLAFALERTGGTKRVVQFVFMNTEIYYRTAFATTGTPYTWNSWRLVSSTAVS